MNNMKIGIITDIYSNIQALNVILNEFDRQNKKRQNKIAKIC